LDFLIWEQNNPSLFDLIKTEKYEIKLKFKMKSKNMKFVQIFKISFSFRHLKHLWDINLYKR